MELARFGAVHRFLHDDDGEYGLQSAVSSVIIAISFLNDPLQSTYSVKMQYAQLKFGWTSVQLGNFISLIGATRIVALCVAIPLLIKLIRKPHKEPERDPHPSAVNADGANDEEEAGSSSSSRTARDPRNVNASGFSKIEDEEWDAHKKQHRLIHDYSELQVEFRD